MPTQEQLEKLNHVDLAVLCSRVADDPKNYTEEGASKGRALKIEWASFQTPPELSLKDEQQKRSDLESWKRRAAAFLAGIL